MKSSLIFLCLLSLSAFAKENLSSMKQASLMHLTHKMNIMNQAKTCIENSSTVETYKACKYDMLEGMKMQKMEEMDRSKNPKK